MKGGLACFSSVGRCATNDVPHNLKDNDYYKRTLVVSKSRLVLDRYFWRGEYCIFMPALNSGDVCKHYFMEISTQARIGMAHKQNILNRF